MTAATVQPDNERSGEGSAAPRRTATICVARGWAALPASYRIPDVAPTLEEARAWCQQLAESHYENFHVASWFLARTPASALSRHLRLLPRLRRSGRRGWATAAGPGAARSVGPRTGRLLRRPRASSGLCRAGRDHPRLLHSQGALCRSADRLSPGSDRHALRNHGGRAGLLPLLGQSGRPPGALRLRRSRAKNTSASPMQPAPRCNWPTSGRMCAWTSPRAASTCRRTTCGASASATTTIAAGIATPEFRALLRLRSRLRAFALRAGPAADRHGQPRSGARSRSVQPRRPGDSARHRAPRITTCSARARPSRRRSKLALALRAAQRQGFLHFSASARASTEKAA